MTPAAPDASAPRGRAGFPFHSINPNRHRVRSAATQSGKNTDAHHAEEHRRHRHRVVSTPYEMLRATLPAFTPDGEQATVIITRQGQGSAGRVWITFSGAWVTRAVMTDEQAERLEDLSVTQDGHVGEHGANGPINASVWPSRLASGSRVASVQVLPSRVVSVAAEVEVGD
jgi:hypothetical protein